MSKAEDKVIVNFRAERSLREAFDLAAKANDRPASQLLREFMRDYVKKHAKAASLLPTGKGDK